MHITKIDAANPCYPLLTLESLGIDIPDKIFQRGGYDMRGVKCDLWSLADPKITAKAGQPWTWRVRHSNLCDVRSFSGCSMHWRKLFTSLLPLGTSAAGLGQQDPIKVSIKDTSKMTIASV